MGTSLVFHIVFSVLGVGLPLLLCIAEGLALWKLAEAPTQAPQLWRGMLDHALWAVAVTILVGIITAAALFLHRYRLARMLIAVDTGALLGAWGLAQLPYIVPPDLTVIQAASPPPRCRHSLSAR
jgi:cytochrome bd-type quinol oxidase subunit 2